MNQGAAPAYGLLPRLLLVSFVPLFHGPVTPDLTALRLPSEVRFSRVDGLLYVHHPPSDLAHGSYCMKGVPKLHHLVSQAGFQKR